MKDGRDEERAALPDMISEVECWLSLLCANQEYSIQMLTQP